MRARRALLYVPGNEWHKIEKASALNADCVCLDLEDGVASNRKTEARATVSRALETLSFGASERLVRINAVGSGLESDDLDAVSQALPDGVVIPKVTDAEQVRWVSARLSEIEQSKAQPDGSIGIIAMIENARGLLNLSSISASDARLQALIFGAEDYAADIGATRTREGLEVLYARSAIVATASAFGLQAIDLLFTDFRDLEGLHREAEFGSQLGYGGMQVIHPNQITPVQEAYTPDDAAIANALQVMLAASTNLAEGRGAFALDGRMIDMPIIKSAERLLARARAAGKIS